MMRLDASGFDAAWQYLCARALVDQAHGMRIASFIREDGHWIQAVRPGRIRITSRLPKGKGARRLARALYGEEWQQLTRLGHSSHTADQAVWNLFARYFESVGRNTPAPLGWTSFVRTPLS